MALSAENLEAAWSQAIDVAGNDVVHLEGIEHAIGRTAHLFGSVPIDRSTCVGLEQAHTHACMGAAGNAAAQAIGSIAVDQNAVYPQYALGLDEDAAAAPGEGGIAFIVSNDTLFDYSLRTLVVAVFGGSNIQATTLGVLAGVVGDCSVLHSEAAEAIHEDAATGRMHVVVGDGATLKNEGGVAIIFMGTTNKHAAATLQITLVTGSIVGGMPELRT